MENQISVLDRELPRLGKLVVHASVRLGQQAMTLNDLCQLKPGTVITISTPGYASQELTVSDRVVATGSVVRCGTQLGFRVGTITPESK
jgi:flagellar motor switch/type III secretory pathway protein FliN